MTQTSETVPSAVLRVCLEPGCAVRVPRGRCAQHQRVKRAEHQRHFAGVAGLNYGRRWKKLRALFLERNPLCKECSTDGTVERATEVDHKVPHRGDYFLFWDEDNWQPLCKRHHSAKTAREVGWTRAMTLNPPRPADFEAKRWRAEAERLQRDLQRTRAELEAARTAADAWRRAAIHGGTPRRDRV